jgi:hypothetical protein
MHGPINVKSTNNTSKWQMEFNSAFKWLTGACDCVAIKLIYVAKEADKLIADQGEPSSPPLPP